MIIHQQLLPPKKPLLHIIVTSEKRFITAVAVHSMVFSRPKKVQFVTEEFLYGTDGGWVVKMHKGRICQLSILLIMHKR